MSGILSNIAKGLMKGGVSILDQGSFFLTIVEELKSGEYRRRLDDFMNHVDSQLEAIKELQIQQMVDNQLFATVLYIAGQMALKTNDAKRKLLANAVVNSHNSNLSEERVIMLLNCIEKYTMSHLNLLHFLHNPKLYYQGDGFSMGSTMSIYDRINRNRDKSLDNIVIQDLHSDGFINVDSNSLNTTSTSAGMLEKRTTGLGDDMISFFGITKFDY